jgi:hypothetical protein
MPLLNLFKLEKLRIEAYKDDIRKTPANPARMEVMFNPTSYKQKHTITYASPGEQGMNMPARPARYGYTPPGDLSFQLVLDGTGVNSIGVAAVGRKSVKDHIKTFRKLCLDMNGDIHEPNFLIIRWGDAEFHARLKSLDITYKLFDESGDPLRAELDVTFVSDKPAATIAREAGKRSPDLTHVRIVRSGDTLPLLCREIYGSSEYYLRVAVDNDLDDFRELVPGRRLRFAPLPDSAGEAGASADPT